MEIITQSGIARAVAMFENKPAKLAEAVGNGVLRQHVEHWLPILYVTPYRYSATATA